MPTNRNRKSIRLKNYDYSQEGAYFVTICTHSRECIFGSILNEQMHLNQIGKIIQTEWIKSAQIRKEIVLGEFVIMPNHIHGIIWIVNPSVGMAGNNDFEFNSDVGAYGHTTLRQTGIQFNGGNMSLWENSGNQNIGKFQSPSRTLGAMIRGFKSASTKQTCPELAEGLMKSAIPPAPPSSNAASTITSSAMNGNMNIITITF